MKKFISLFFAATLTFVLCSFSQRAPLSVEAINPTDKTSQSQDIRSQKFEPARKMLREAAVPFDPEILLQRDWKNRLEQSLTTMTEMQSTFRAPNKLSGVQIADTIILPEKVELTGDLVILANRLVLEGSMTQINGIGNNVYIFPIRETFHLGRSFEDLLRERLPKDAMLRTNERTNEKFEFDTPNRQGIIQIEVPGQGHHDWLKKYNIGAFKVRVPNRINPETDCPPQSPTCAGEPGARGGPGADGIARGIPAAPPYPGLHGRCRRGTHMQDGLHGNEGENGGTGPENAGRGNKGNNGGTGGTIMFRISGPPFQMGYVFDAHGGMGGPGGPGGIGAPGDPGQEGGWGGDGADCPCVSGGGGSGADGTDGGKGGQGGRGGAGGPGGDGGPGGAIFVEFPNDFDASRIVTRLYGGPPGNGGEGGVGGSSGVSGEGGRSGRALGNSNCPSTEGRDGRPGIQPAPLGPSERGPRGLDGTVWGTIGEYSPHRLGPRGGCGGFTAFDLYPTTGCATGFINVGGSCTRSDSFIRGCDRFSGYDPNSCGCIGACDPSQGSCSPIVVDTLGDGFAMTSGPSGVMFDLQGNGNPRRFSWTAGGSDDAWLSLDRNNDGLIDSGRELFGNITSQPPPPDGEEMNGFLALAEYDTAGFGGNGDGKISQQDAIFDRLRVWRDSNHNGISEPAEMFTLMDTGLRTIDLDYRRSRRVDEFGNQFRYRAKVRDARGSQLGRWAWDVFLISPE